MNWFASLLLGHLVGDYILQNDYMALNKKKNWTACLIHCFIYTFTICLALNGHFKISFLLIVLIFMSHIVLDKTNFVENAMSLMGTRSILSNIPRNEKGEIDFKSTNMTAEQIIKTIFGCFIYIAVDNTLHLLMMCGIVKFLYGV